MRDKLHIRNSEKIKGREPSEIIANLIRNLNFEKTVLIAVGGPGGSGKSTFCKRLNSYLNDSVILTLDDYKTSRKEREGKKLFGAHPEANRISLIKEHFGMLKNNIPIEKPVYNSVTGEIDSTVKITPKKYIIIDGEISTYTFFREFIDFSIFIDSDWKTQLNTRISRDIEERKYSKEKAIKTFLQSNLKEFSKFGAESKNWCDIQIFCNSDYELRIESVSEKYLNAFETLIENNYKKISLEGLIVPILTPFDESLEVDFNSLLRHMDFLVSNNIKRILVCGTTGEFPSLTSKERHRIFKTLRMYFPGQLLFQVGRTSIKDTLDEISFAEDYGADAILAIPPYYYADVSANSLIEYFNLLEGNTGLPFIIYNFPKHTGNKITKEILSGAKHYGMKDSSGDIDLIPFTKNYFTGRDDKIFESLKLGARGYVIGNANLFPEIYSSIEKNNPSGDLEETVLDIYRNFALPNKIKKLKEGLSEKIKGYPINVRLPLK